MITIKWTYTYLNHEIRIAKDKHTNGNKEVLSLGSLMANSVRDSDVFQSDLKNQDMRVITGVTDVVYQMAKLKWNWTGYVHHLTDGLEGA